MLEVTRQRDAFQILGKKLKAHFPCRNLNDAKGGSPLLGDGLVQTDSISVQNRSITIPTASMPETIFTLAFWMKHSTAPTGGWDRPLLMRQSRQPGMWLYADSNAIHISTFLTDGTNQINTIADMPDNPQSQVAPNTWTHILHRLRYSPELGFSTLSQFVNGVKLIDLYYNGYPYPVQSALSFSAGFPCWVSDIRTYDHFLTDQECQTVFAQANKLKPVGS